MSKWYWKNGRLAVDLTPESFDDPKMMAKMAKVEKRLGDFDYKVVGRNKLPTYPLGVIKDIGGE